MIRDYFFLAFGNLRHKGLRSLLTMLGIFIGIAAVVSLISLGQGLQDTITGQFSVLDADKLIIQNAGAGFGPPGSTVVNKLTEDDLNLISNVDGVKETVVRYIRVVSVEENKFRRFVTVTSVPKNSIEIEIVKDALNVEMAEGKFLEGTDRGKIVIGGGFDEDDFGKKISIGTNLDVQGENFKVTGIMKKGSNFFINNAILMAEDDLKDILEIGDEIDLIVVQVENENQIEEVAEDISRKLRRDRKLKPGEEDFSVETPLQGVSTINSILGTIKIVIAGIAAISLVIGGVGIANSMYTSVLERTKEIGIMKSVGAKNKDILFIFLIESAFLGLAGGVIGSVLGLGLAFGASALVSAFLGGIDLQVKVSLPLITAAISFSLLIGILTGIIPALQASRLNPVEALRR